MRKDKGNFLIIIFSFFLFFLPLLFNPTNYVVFEPTKNIFLRLTVLFSLLYLAFQASKGEVKIYRSSFDFPISLFLGSAFLSTLFAYNIHTSFYGDLYRYEGFISFLCYFFLFYLGYNFYSFSKGSNWVIYSIFLSSSLVSAYAILQHFGWDFLKWNPQEMDLSRSFSTFGNPVFLGAYLALVIPLTFSYFLKKEATSLGRKAVTQFSLVFLLAIQFSALIFSYARASWLAIFFSSLFLLYKWRRNFKKDLIPFFLIFFILLSFFCFMPSPKLPSGFLSQRVLSFLEVSQGSIKSRIFIWHLTLKLLSRSPLIGFGLDNLRFPFNQEKPFDWFRKVGEKSVTDKTHNEFLQVASAQGFLGMLFYLWLITLILGRGFQKMGEKPNLSSQGNDFLKVGFFASILAYLIQVQFSFGIISVTPIFWLFSGFFFSPKGKEHFSFSWLTNKHRRWGLYLALFLIGVLSLVTGLKALLAESHFKTGLTLLNNFQFDEAINHLEKAVEFNSGESSYFMWLGEANHLKFKMNREESTFQLAEKAFQNAQKLNPWEREIFYFQGNLYLDGAQVFGEKFYLKSADNYRKAIRLDPLDLESRFNLGLVHARQKNYSSAIKSWKKIIQVDSLFVEAYFNIAKAYEKMGKEKEAQNWLQKAQELTSKK